MLRYLGIITIGGVLAAVVMPYPENACPLVARSCAR
jgi:hypothetical protein